MEQRINDAWDTVLAQRASQLSAQRVMDDAEETARMDNLEEWVAAKNNDVRRAIVLRELAGDPHYHASRQLYREARDGFRLAMLEIERLRMLIEAAKVEESRSARGLYGS